MVFENFDPELVIRLLLAAGLGGLIGFEREKKGRPAGLRTHMLVSLGATIATIVSQHFTLSPAEIAGSIVTGVGFIAAGRIISMGGSVKGMASAATIWVVASIGLAVGVGQYVIAIVSAIIVFFILQIKKGNLTTYSETKT